MEPLSKPLMEWLDRLNLATPADLRRCRGRVRQLAKDLPAFDSVWIDALVHARKLTAFQARLLESGEPDKLAVGPCVLVDQMGRGTSATFLARHHKSDERCVLKLIRIPEEQRHFALESLRQLVARAENLSHPSAVAPKSCLSHGPDLVTVSRFVSGPALNQLLVRRGRFPAQVVLALAKQIIEGCAALENCGLLHGDLRLQNLRLAASGRVVMVDAGIAPAIHPELTFHARISPEHYDGVAPELIGTGNPPDTRSEFYAIGCLLWQLLAGRPPFPTGDPLAKLAAHQTRRVPDVRDIAPDTPAELADILRAFTDPDPHRRPPSFDAFHSRWSGPKRMRRRQLARFRRLFNTAVPYIPAMTPEPVSPRWPMVAALMFLLCGASFFLMDAGAYTRLLAIPGELEEYINSPATTDGEPSDAATEADERRGEVLPAPDAQGVIELPHAGPYRGSQIEAVGPLTIRGPSGTLSQILIGDTPLRIFAADVRLENVAFRPIRETPPGDDRPMLQITSSSLVLNRCSFQRGEADSGTAPAGFQTGIEWKSADRLNPASGRVSFENCVFAGPGIACRLQTWPSEVVVKNCLKTDAGVLLGFAADPHPLPHLQLKLSQLTLRGASGFLRCDSGAKAGSSSWRIQAEDCVFDLHAGSSAVFQSAGDSSGRFFQRLQLEGRNCLLNESAAVAGWWNPLGSEFQPLDSSTLTIEGLVLARLMFAGPQNHRPANSELASWQGPRFSSKVPGIIPADLPGD